VPEPGAWQVLAAQTLLDRSPWLRVIAQSVRLPSGLVIPDYLLAPSRDFSLVVAVTADSQVLLVRQYKHGLGRVVLDFPAGYQDTPDEEPLACAQRELREETGYSAGRWTPLGALALDMNRSARAPGWTTPMAGTGRLPLSSRSSAAAVAVLQATTTSLQFCAAKKSMNRRK
jgi:ADP-ribose pyrophosphatase YjhB (NUDIX family)